MGDQESHFPYLPYVHLEDQAVAATVVEHVLWTQAVKLNMFTPRRRPVLIELQGNAPTPRNVPAFVSVKRSVIRIVDHSSPELIAVRKHSLSATRSSYEAESDTSNFDRFSE